MENFSVEDFKELINRKIKSLLENIEKQHLKTDAQTNYNGLLHYSWNIKLEEEAIKLNLDKDLAMINNINEGDIQEALLDTFKDQVTAILNEPYDKKVTEYTETQNIDIQGFKEILEELK